MVFTPRSILVGLIAWLLAFLAAYFGAINPVHLTPNNILLLTASLVIGFTTVIALGNRCCHRKGEGGNAVTVFSCSWLVGIYLPITAIWANAPFYAWALTQKVKPKPGMMDSPLVRAIEMTGLSHYLGSVALLTLGYAIAKCMGKFTTNKEGTGPNLFVRLDRIDILFGILSFAGGFLIMIFDESCRLSTGEQWLAYGAAAFLACFLFRSLRLDCLTLAPRLPHGTARSISKRTGFMGVASLWICWGSITVFAPLLLFRNGPEASGWLSVLGAGILISPWILFRLAAGKPTETEFERSRQVGQFAIRCGVWSGFAISLLFVGLIMTTMTQRELRLGYEGPTPFAWAVQALKPLCCISGVMALGAYAGSLIIAAVLPRPVRSTERIMACAQGGAAMVITNFVFLILFALNLALLTVPSIGQVVGVPKSLQLPALLADGKWISLSCLSMGLLILGAAIGAALWALEATIDCGLMCVIERVILRLRRRSSKVATKLPIPAKNPPPAPSV